MEQEHADFTIENNILKGKDVPYQSDYTSIGKFVLDILKESPNSIGQIDALTGEEDTYDEMRQRSVRCALWMRSQGLLPEDLVTICSHNHLDIAIPCFAALYLGAAVNPLDAGMNAKEVFHLINITKPKMVFVSVEAAAAVAEAAEQAKLDLKIIVFGRIAGFLDFESIIAQAGVDEVERFDCTPITKRDKIALVMCSSGTTGLPKGVALRHEDILRQTLRSEKFGITGGVCLSFSSLHWINGILCILMSLFSKVTRIIAPPFEEYSACEIIEKYQVSWLFWASTLVSRFSKSGAVEKYKLPCVKLVIYAGAPVALASRETFAKFVPNARILSGYGTTELSGFLSVQTANSKPSSTGQIIENAQLKVIDPSTARVLGVNQSGELVLKSATMMNFYYGNPRATAEAFDEEGWFHTGDLGYYDEDGEVFIVDRLKELIKYRNYHISPVEIETVILSHPGINEVAVVGVPHPTDDEHPLAFVVRATDSSGVAKQVTEEEIIDLVAAAVSDSKRLRGGVRFIDRIPKSPSHKPLRRELRELTKSMASIRNY